MISDERQNVLGAKVTQAGKKLFIFQHEVTPPYEEIINTHSITG